MQRLRRIGAELDARNAMGAAAASVDPYELLQHIESVTGGTIAVKDFVPISVAMLLEPLLSGLGYGTFRLRASPFCGYVLSVLYCMTYSMTFLSACLFPH